MESRVEFKEQDPATIIVLDIQEELGRTEEPNMIHISWLWKRTNTW